jgi:hypothetical protein
MRDEIRPQAGSFQCRGGRRAEIVEHPVKTVTGEIRNLAGEL